MKTAAEAAAESLDAYGESLKKAQQELDLIPDKIMLINQLFP